MPRPAARPGCFACLGSETRVRRTATRYVKGAARGAVSAPGGPFAPFESAQEATSVRYEHQLGLSPRHLQLQQRRFELHQLVVVACTGKFAAPIHHYCGHLGSGEYLKAQLGQLFRKVCQGRGLPAAWPSSEYQSEYVRLPLMRPCSTKTGNSSAACICTRSRTRAPSVTTFAAARCAREDSPLAVPLSNKSCSRSIRDFLDDLDSVIGARCSREYA
jgi:hypothetical protein